MSEQKNWQLRPEHSGCLLRLQKILDRVQGFRLLILAQNQPLYRDGMIAFLRAAEPDSALLDLKEPGSFVAFEAQLEQYKFIRELHLINLEGLAKAEQQAFFKGLNYHREHIARTCLGSLIFWLPEPLIRDMALLAPDFWAWREQVLDFTLPLEPVERVESHWTEIANTAAQGKQERIREIKSFLAHSFEQTLTTADLKGELGILYWSSGNYIKAKKMLEAAITDYGKLDEAQACARTRRGLARLLFDQGYLEQALSILRQQVLPIFQRLKDKTEQAYTMGKIADILQASGQLDEALRIRTEEELPVYETVGNIYSQAVTKAKIGDILRDRGQFNEALRIKKEEVLPMFEQLGDVRAKAITLGKVADILKIQGQLDEALKIYEEDILPVFEGLGDIQKKAVTMGKIADILTSRGQLDEALKVREQEELPVYERLGALHKILLCRAKIALLLQKIDTKANKTRIDELLRLALADAKRLKLPGETAWIEEIMKKLPAQVCSELRMF